MVDATLKDLKICTRRLQTALSSHKSELQVLEKLHYKNNNQHRTALFWRRVVDIRRSARRVDELELFDVVETLRLSFWGDPSLHKPKILKGSWTHVPDISAVRVLSKRLLECRTLIRDSQERCLLAHNQFNLNVQTGAFLQLLLVLTGIASRLHILLEEVGQAIDQGVDALNRVMSVLDPASTPRSVLNTAESKSRLVSSGPSSGAMNHRDEDGVEDVGEANPLPPIATVASQEPPSGAEEVADTARVDPTNFMFDLAPTNPNANKIVRRPVIRTATATKPKRKSEQDRASRPAKKKGKKKDEIDDIFGL